MKIKEIAVILSCFLLVGCSVKEGKTRNRNDRLEKSSMDNSFFDKLIKGDAENNDRIDIGVEILPIQGNKSDFKRLDENTQEILKNYLDGFYTATLQAVENQDKIYNYKNDYIKSFENNFESINLNYINDKAALNVITDFYQLSYICAIYELRILHSNLVISDYGSSNTMIIDDAYVQYISDLTEIITNLNNEYLS